MEKNESLWQTFAHNNDLSPLQLAQFQRYYAMLMQANELFNITTIVDLEKVIAYHFEDSLAIDHFVDLTQVTSLGDIGSGGGFPGIPLKIKYPHLQVTLIEVHEKKRDFLQQVITANNLFAITTNSLDWRTFLRKSESPIDVFCARASLQPDELIRLFSPSTIYHASKLVYWASSTWAPEKKVAPYLKQCHPYLVGYRERKYCIFSGAS